METLYYIGGVITVICIGILLYIVLRNRQRLETSYDGENTFDELEELIKKSEELEKKIQGARDAVTTNNNRR